MVGTDAVRGSVALHGFLKTSLSCHVAAIVCKRFRRIFRLPTTLILESLREIPVVESTKWLASGFAKFVYVSGVTIDSFPVRSARSCGEDEWS